MRKTTPLHLWSALPPAALSLLLWFSPQPPTPGGPSGRTRPVTPTAAVSRSLIRAAYAQQPLHFEANRGQTDSVVKFLARGNGYGLFLTADEAVLTLRQTSEQPDAPDAGRSAPERHPGCEAVVRMKLIGANPQPRMIGQEELPGKVNYFIGNDPQRWRTNIPTYAQVKYEAVYPGVDLVYYGNPRQLEYDFVVAPGADPAVIRLGFQGARQMELDAAGHLVLHTDGGPIIQHAPYIYQDIDGARRTVPGRYVLLDAPAAAQAPPAQVASLPTRPVGFRVEAYDTTRPLVIDPVLAYSTYFGGTNTDRGAAIAVDGDGSAYVTGDTISTDYPTTPGAFQRQNSFAAFITKFNANGALVYSTYLGGTIALRGDAAYSIAVDGGGNAYVTGATDSEDFPTTPGAFDRRHHGDDYDVFVTVMNSTGSRLVYSTYLGTAKRDIGYGIALDPVGNAYVTGYIEDAIRPGELTYADVFVAKIDPTAAGDDSLVYARAFGGDFEDIGYAIAVDGDGNAYITGGTRSRTFPITPGAFDPNYHSFTLLEWDPFVTKVDGAGNIIYSTFLGGFFRDIGYGIAVDGDGNAYVTGETRSTTNEPFPFPVTPGAFQATNNGESDAFVTVLNADGSDLIYSTYLGGERTEVGRAIALDGDRNAYVTGETASPDFPLERPFQNTYGGRPYDNAFVTKLSSDGSALVYSSYLGGSQPSFGHNDHGKGIAVDANGVAYVAGETESTNFPTFRAWQPRLAGGFDVFVTKIVD